MCAPSDIYCGDDPGIPKNGQRDTFSTVYTSEVRYSCFTGYTLQGSDRRTCQSNGEWSGNLPKCNRRFIITIYCSRLIKLPPARMLCTFILLFSDAFQSNESCAVFPHRRIEYFCSIIQFSCIWSRGRNVPHKQGYTPHREGYIPHKQLFPHKEGYIPHKQDYIPHKQGNIPHKQGNIPH